MHGSWKPEYARYMLESTPLKPFGGTLADLVTVEDDMVKRRKLAQSVLKPNQYIVSMTVFPYLGVGDFLTPSTPVPTPLNGASRSLYIPDCAINPHPRFAYVLKP